MSTPFYGYRIDLEHRDDLRLQSLPPEAMNYDFADVPEEVDSRKWHRIENQRNIGSCQGHMNSSLGEFAFYIATGTITQFSPIYSYYATQKIDGLNGRDDGSTIQGGAQCAKTYGYCPADIMPYPDRYKWELPQRAIEAAEPFKIKSTMAMRNERDVFKFISSGQGGVGVGIVWNDDMTPNSEGLILNYDSSDNRGGGHAVPLLGYTKRKASDGRNFYLLPNSWHVTWGINGWAEVHPRVVDNWFNNRFTVIYGFSDLSAPKPRKIDYSMW